MTTSNMPDSLALGLNGGTAPTRPLPLSKAVVVGTYDPADPTAWSGVPHFFTRALSKLAAEVIIIAPLVPRPPLAFRARVSYHFARGRRYLIDRDREICAVRGREASSAMRAHEDADVVFVFHPPDAAQLDTSAPIAIVHDSTWRQLTSDYPAFSRSILATETFSDAVRLEEDAFARARWLLFFSNWAANAARDEYPQFAHKVTAILPGGGFTDPPCDDLVDRSITDRSLETIQLLFVGYEAYRKGLDIAVTALLDLTREGRSAALTIVGAPGCDPLHPLSLNLSQALPLLEGFTNERYPLPVRMDAAPAVTIFGPLNRGRGEEAELLNGIYSRSSVLLVPSRADCASLALCDGAAFGLPAVTSGVGGIAELVIDGTTGFVLGPDVTGRAYATAVNSLCADRSRYLAMARAARRRSREVLNWETHVRKFAEVVLDRNT